jgi:hypothetical protein
MVQIHYGSLCSIFYYIYYLTSRSFVYILTSFFLVNIIIIIFIFIIYHIYPRYLQLHTWNKPRF